MTDRVSQRVRSNLLCLWGRGGEDGHGVSGQVALAGDLPFAVGFDQVRAHRWIERRLLVVRGRRACDGAQPRPQR